MILCVGIGANIVAGLAGDGGSICMASPPGGGIIERGMPCALPIIVRPWPRETPPKAAEAADGAESAGGMPYMAIPRPCRPIMWAYICEGTTMTGIMAPYSDPAIGMPIFGTIIIIGEGKAMPSGPGMLSDAVVAAMVCMGA